MARARTEVVGTYLQAGREASRLSVLFRATIAAKADIGANDAECLDFLLEAGSATAGQLAERTNLTTGAITGLIRRLETAGYITATRDPADRRRVILTPVLENLAGIRALYAAYQQAGQRIIDTYTIEQLQFLTDHYRAMSEFYASQLHTLAE